MSNKIHVSSPDQHKGIAQRSRCQDLNLTPMYFNEQYLEKKT